MAVPLGNLRSSLPSSFLASRVSGVRRERSVPWSPGPSMSLPGTVSTISSSEPARSSTSRLPISSSVLTSPASTEVALATSVAPAAAGLEATDRRSASADHQRSRRWNCVPERSRTSSRAWSSTRSRKRRYWGTVCRFPRLLRLQENRLTRPCSVGGLHAGAERNDAQDAVGFPHWRGRSDHLGGSPGRCRGDQPASGTHLPFRCAASL